MNEWIVWNLGAALVGAGNTVLDKKLASQRVLPARLFALSFGVVALPVALGVLWLPPLPVAAAGAALAAGLLFVVAAWLYYRALGQMAVGQVVALMRLTGVQGWLLAALFLGERLTWAQGASVGLALIGGLLLAHEPGQRPVRNRASATLLLATTLLALESVLLAPVYREHSLAVGLAWTSLGQVGGALLLLATCCDRGSLWVQARAGGGALWGPLLGEQAGRLLVRALSGQVVSQGVPLAVVAALGELRPLFTLLLAAWLLGESWPRAARLPRGLGILLVGASVGLAAWP